MTAISGDRKRSSRLKEKTLDGYNFAYLDDQTKRMIRRATLKAVAIPGYQVPLEAGKCLFRLDGVQEAYR